MIKKNLQNIFKKLAYNIFIIFYGILDNFGVNGGRNGYIYLQSIGKFDNAFAIVFTIFNLLIINQIITNVYKKNDLRANIKSEINNYLGSNIKEVKSHN